MSETRLRILDDIKTAMKAGDKLRLGTLRLIAAAIKQKEVDDRVDLSEQDTIAVLDKMLKQRRESITQYDKAGRDDLKQVEEQEVVIIQDYMPAAMEPSEIEALIRNTIEKTGASSVKDMGKVMAQIKPVLQGRADMSSVSATIKSLLSAG